jgi:hypothetical protein
LIEGLLYELNNPDEGIEANTTGTQTITTKQMPSMILNFLFMGIPFHIGW